MQIKINKSGNWKLYQITLPQGAKALGTITRNEYDTGAYIELSNGIKVQMNANVIRSVPNN